MSMTCSWLSQPATNVCLPATRAEPLTGPWILYFQATLPSFTDRQYSVESCEPISTRSSAKLAPPVISPFVSNSQRFVPVAASTQWNIPSSSPTNTASPWTLGGALIEPALYFHFSCPDFRSKAYRWPSKQPT